MKTFITSLTVFFLLIHLNISLNDPTPQERIKKLKDELMQIENELKSLTKNTINYNEIYQHKNTVNGLETISEYQIYTTLENFSITVKTESKENKIVKTTNYTLPIINKPNLLIKEPEYNLNLEEEDELIACDKIIKVNFLNNNLKLYRIEFSGFTPVTKVCKTPDERTKVCTNNSFFYYLLNTNDKEYVQSLLNKYLNIKIKIRNLEMGS